MPNKRMFSSPTCQCADGRLGWLGDSIDECNCPDKKKDKMGIVDRIIDALKRFWHWLLALFGAKQMEDEAEEMMK